MAKRRRRIKIKNSSLFAFIVLSLLATAAAALQHQHQQQQNFHHQQDFATKFSSSQYHHQLGETSASQHTPHGGGSGGGTSTAHLCAQLPAHQSKHLKLCKLISHSPNADHALALGASNGLAECRNQFKSERWNCTHAHGDHHLLTSELAQSVGNRESGFVHAIAAAGIVHSIATACSVGNLSDCACDKSRIGSYWHMDEKWKWGGCSHNIRHGMLYAKHLVELLDAVHQRRWQLHHHHHQQQQQPQLQHRQYRSSSLSDSAGGSSAAAAANGELNFCQRNHNISRAAHFKLIKSLLSAHSLERHHEFRLAMNMHNNKVGRMAVAKNMEFRCRCHGLSGSCSLKTCWLSLPNFQVIGAYLKRKYEASVHLPTAVDVNKLIPMMNRDEISAILSNQVAAATSAAAEQVNPQSGEQSRPVESSVHEDTTTDYPAMLGDLQADQPAAPSRLPLSGHFIVAPTNQPAQRNHSDPPPASHYSSLYERHKQLEAAPPERPHTRQPPAANNQTGSEQQPNEIPVNIAPLSQQQYQALLRDMRLCNTTSNQPAAAAAAGSAGAAQAALAPPTTVGYLTKRDLGQHHHLHQQQLAHQPPGGGTHKQPRHTLRKLNSNQQQVAAVGQPAPATSGHALKSANQHLSQVLQHSNRDELIYLHRSPNYCEADLRHGFLGIQSRVCSDNPSAPNHCDKLCCGRGYTTRIYQHSYNCDCKFQYCCSIHCSSCERETKLLVCN